MAPEALSELIQPRTPPTGAWLAALSAAVQSLPADLVDAARCVGLLTDKNAAYDSSSNRTGADVHAKRDIHMLTTNCKCLQRGAPGCRASDGNGE